MLLSTRRSIQVQIYGSIANSVQTDQVQFYRMHGKSCVNCSNASVRIAWKQLCNCSNPFFLFLLLCCCSYLFVFAAAFKERITLTLARVQLDTLSRCNVGSVPVEQPLFILLCFKKSHSPLPQLTWNFQNGIKRICAYL